MDDNEELGALLRAIVRRSQPKADERPPEDIIQEASTNTAPVDAPWALQQHFDGEINLEAELARRFPEMAVMPHIKIRPLGEGQRREVATMTTADNAAHAVIDADLLTGNLILSFTLSSMLTLRFSLHDISPRMRQRWLDLMRRPEGGVAFLWGPARWESDYLACVVHKYYTNLYCFSPNNFEAGIRMTNIVTEKLVDWLVQVWSSGDDNDDTPPTLLTW